MRMVRGDAVRKARQTLMPSLSNGISLGQGKNVKEEREKGSGSWGVILGTLGRQGSLSVLKVSQISLSSINSY